MKKAYSKNIRRSITESMGRYIAIMLIIMLGVAFFAGLRQTRSSMLAVEFEYLEETKLYDLRLISTIGFEDEDIEEISEIDGVETAVGSINADFITQIGSDEYVYHAMMLTEGVNEPQLVSGRMPESANECLADSQEFSEDDIGTTIVISDSNNEDTLDTFAYTEYTIVGICRSPLYLDISRGTTSLGSGSVTGFIIILEEGFNSEYYTEVYVTSTEKYDPYTDEYNDMIDSFSELVGDETEAIINSRFDGIVSDAETEIADAENELEESRAEAQQELDDAWAELQDALTELQDGETELEDAKAELEDALIAIEDAESELADAKTQLDDALEELNDAEETLSEQLTALEEAKTMVELYGVGEEEYNAGLAQYTVARETLDQSWESYYSSLADYENGLDELEDARQQYEDGLADYEEGVAELEDGWVEYYDGLAGYEDGVAELESEVADAEAEIADAKAELDDLEEPELYTFTRSINSGYVTFESDSLIVSNVARLLPIFFFLIAALVCSTTMTRMVDDERTQIGILSALGYGKGAILSKYIIYSGTAAVIGSVVGYFAGSFLFPLVIVKAYTILYNIEGFVYIFNAGYFAVSLVLSLLCSVGPTVIACRSALKCPPADLIRPKSPPAGKRIWLERITPVWSRLKFMHKVTVRNIFRFKKRMVMMLMGIAGCTALVLTAFGINDSIANLGNFQFDDILTYDISVNFSDEITEEDLANISDELSGTISSKATSMSYSTDVSANDVYKTAYYIISDDEHFSDVISLHLDDEEISLPTDGGVLVSEKLASMLGIDVGDSITVYTTEGKTAEATVSGLVENYVQHYIYMTDEAYEEIFGEEYESSTLMLRLNDDADDYSVSAALLNMDGISTVTVVNDTRQMIDNMMQSLNYVVLLILFCAAALALIVMFNLGNINISERAREIATIKVIGFRKSETNDYVFRENIVLTLMGIVIGLPLGVLLHAFVMSQIKVDMVSFKVIISPQSFVFTVILVVLFAIITDLILRKKISAIDMAESLKSVE
ncbi:MAG: FtsX-like permease family protein [Oscillospiraceae bacterium]|nr:FtsX-like permease family protein [Oscillospiraceae bacterium]